MQTSAQLLIKEKTKAKKAQRLHKASVIPVRLAVNHKEPYKNKQTPLNKTAMGRRFAYWQH